MGSKKPHVKTDDVRIYRPEQHEYDFHLFVPMSELLPQAPGSVFGFETEGREPESLNAPESRNSKAA
jgi:hypothetical protein